MFLGALLSRKCNFMGASAGAIDGPPSGDCIPLRLVRTEAGFVGNILATEVLASSTRAAKQLERALEGPLLKTRTRE